MDFLDKFNLAVFVGACGLQQTVHQVGVVDATGAVGLFAGGIEYLFVGDDHLLHFAFLHFGYERAVVGLNDAASVDGWLQHSVYQQQEQCHSDKAPYLGTVAANLLFGFLLLLPGVIRLPVWKFHKVHIV